MYRIAHAAGDLLHGVGEILLKVNGFVDGPVLGVDLLLLRDELLLDRSSEYLVGVLLRMDL